MVGKIKRWFLVWSGTLLTDVSKEINSNVIMVEEKMMKAPNMLSENIHGSE